MVCRQRRDAHLKDVQDPLTEAAEVYKYVIHLAPPGPPLHTALYRLAELTLHHPHLSNNSSSWELLVSAADEGNALAQHALSAALSVGVWGDFVVPTDPGRGLLLEYMSALSGEPSAALGKCKSLFRG